MWRWASASTHSKIIQRGFGAWYSRLTDREWPRARAHGTKMVQVWDVQMEGGCCQHTPEGHSEMVSSVVFSPDGSRAVWGSFDTTVRVWDVQTGEYQHTLRL
jgi:WD40 repeat protein